MFIGIHTLASSEVVEVPEANQRWHSAVIDYVCKVLKGAQLKQRIAVV